MRQGAERTVCRIAIIAFAVLYAAALAVFAAGTPLIAGEETADPLSAVFLLPLGLPWSRLLSPVPEPLLPWFAALAPGLNLALLALLCRVLRRRG